MKADKDQAVKELKELLKPGDTVYTILRHVSSSGVTRHISLKVVETSFNWDISQKVGNESKIRDITFLVAQALEDKLIESKGHRAIKTNNCGEDAGYALVYSLSSKLFSGEDRGGYKLKHEWA